VKRVGGLFDAIADRHTLGLAAWRAAQGKRGRPEVRQFLGNLDAETARIIRELRAGEYCFGAYRTFPIRDPKTRLIHAPPFRDRVVHYAVVAVAGPVFERGAIAQSHACRTGRGQHAALTSARGWTRTGEWFLKADVAKYYDSVEHDRLRESLARRFRERRLLALFDALLASHAAAPGRGLPIGALTSQYLGNFYLDPFDHWVTQGRHMPRYLRYMDDFLCFGPPDALRALRDGSEAILAGLGLRLKHGGLLNRCELGVPWLGFVVYPDRVRLNRPGRRRLRRRLKDLERGWERGTVDDAGLQARSEALFAHARSGDDLAWRRMVSQFSRLGETQGPQPRDPRRLVDQHREEVPLGLSQQEEAR
jgi:RNA-directed DNA polymerase